MLSNQLNFVIVAMPREDIRTQNLNKPVDVAEYLFTRLCQIGIRSLHGVPGDFNLVALDYVPKAGQQWVGNCNELNAGESIQYITSLTLIV